MMQRGRGPGRPRHQFSRSDIGVFRRLLGYVRPHVGRLILAGCSLLCGTLLGLAFPWVVRSLIDSVFVHHDERRLNLIAASLLAIFALQGLFTYVETYFVSWIGGRIVTDLRLALFRHLQSLALDFYDAERTGELISRVTNDVNAVQNTVSNSVLSLLQQVVTLVGSIFIIFYLDWRLSLVMLVVAPPIVLTGVFIGRRLGQLSRRTQEVLGESTIVLEEALSNIRVVQAFTREGYEIGRFAGFMEQSFGLILQRTRWRGLLSSSVTFMTFSAITAVLWFGGREVLAGHLTPGGLISFLFYLFMIAGPLGALIGLYSQTREALGAAGRIFEVLDTRPTIRDRPDAQALPPLRERLTFSDVRFQYMPEREVLHGISFTLDAGRVLALVGPSGAGKSTIAALIPRFYDVTGGSIAVDGQDIRESTLEHLRGQIALVPQEPVLFGVSVRENIAYGRLDATDAAIVEAARAANAHDFITQLPSGYETLVGERGVRLSGGQRQRIAIARAILRDPRILILDEATSSLDNESERLVQEALDRLMAGRTTLVIAHRLTTIQRADRILVLDEGQIVEAGTHRELLAREGLYHRLYTLAARSGDLFLEDLPRDEVVAPA